MADRYSDPLINTYDTIHNRAQKAVFMEDFLVCSSAVAPAAGALVQFEYPWWCIGPVPFRSQASVADGGMGYVNIQGDATRAGQIYSTIGSAVAAVTFVPPTNTGKNYLLGKFRFVSYGNPSATVRRLGFCDATAITFAADNNNSINMKWSNANFTLVSRSGGTETVLDSGVAVDTVWHTAVILMLGTGKVCFYLDDVYKGQITTNIPVINFAIGGGESAAAAGDGIEIDYFDVERPIRQL